MMPYTLPIKEAETKTLGELVQFTQTDQRPLILTKDDTAEAVMVLLNPHRFDVFQSEKIELYEVQLLRLMLELDRVERRWGDSAVRQAFVKNFPKRTLKLWKSCPENMQELCVTLDLAAKHLVIELLTKDAIDALRFCLDLIIRDVTDEDKIDACEYKLTSAGLPPIMGGSNELVELYLEEL
ncbi:MAG: hypothetical protein AAF639_43230 [Chloroflexota bacterium]